MRHYRPETFALFRARGQAHLVEEIWAPMCAQSPTLAVLAIEERPWPPKGVGARTIRGIAIAVVSEDGQAMLTPLLLHPAEAINIGLAAALTQRLFETLRDKRIEYASYFVNPDSKVLTTLLGDAGYSAGTARIVYEGIEFINFTARTPVVLSTLGLDKTRMGDVLALQVERMLVSKWSSLLLGLDAGIAPFWHGLTEEAAIFPGIIDWFALPPAMITGTGGPPPIDPIEEPRPAPQ